MDKVLKQRLVGATILIALAVIFVPMLFDGGDDGDTRRDSALDLPPPPSERREVRRVPLNPGRTVEPEPATEAELPPEPEPEPLVVADEITLLAPDEEAAEPGADPAVPDQEPAEPAVSAETLVEAAEEDAVDTVAEAEPEAAPEPDAPVAETAQAGGNWMVQVASFSSAETAERLRDQLDRLGHAAAVDTVVRGETRLHRLQAGPYADRAGAERARSQIATTVSGVEPVVRQRAGTTAAPAQTDAQPGFSVQVGSFAERSNADRLHAQLLENGFEAFLHPDESRTRAIWRVRVGQFPERRQAAAMQRQLSEQAGLEGLVVSHP